MDLFQDETRHRIRTPMLFVARSAYQLDSSVWKGPMPFRTTGS